MSQIVEGRIPVRSASSDCVIFLSANRWRRLIFIINTPFVTNENCSDTFFKPQITDFVISNLKKISVILYDQLFELS